MGNCCSTPVSDKRHAAFLVDVGTGELSTVRAVSQGTAFTRSSELNPFIYVHGQLKYKTAYKTSASSSSKAGPLLVFPIENAPTGSKPWRHPVDTKNTIKALFNHLLFHGGEQVLFASWLNIIGAGKKPSPIIGVLTSLGRLFLLKGSKIKDTFHVGDIHTVAVDGPGEVKLLLSPVHSGTRDAKLPKSYQLSTSPLAGDCLCQALRAVSRVLFANAPPQAQRPEFHGSIQELPLPGLSQDGGFHSAYCIWHNLHSSKIYPSLRDRGEGRAPQFELVTACAGGDWSGPTAIVATRTALKRLELDITGWDATATEAAAWALRYNNVFKSLKVGPRSTPTAALLAPILACNTVLLKFHMEAEGHTFAAPEGMTTLGSALARNTQPGFAEITIAGNKLSGDAATAWAGGFGNLRAGQLVVANLKGCSMDESGSTAVLLSLEAQAQSLSTLILSGNRLGDRGTRGLNKILASDAVSLQALELDNCHVKLDSLGRSLLSCADRLKSLTSLSVSGNKWSSTMSSAARALSNLKILRATSTAIQPDAIQELMVALSGHSIVLDLSFNPAVGAPTGLAAMLRSGIGVRSIKTRECDLGDEGTAAILSAVGDSPAVKVLDLGCNLTSNPGLDAFNRWLQIEVATPAFLNAVASATSIDAAMGVYFTAAERSALQATNNQRAEVEGSPARMQTAMALTQALLPQGSGQALEELAMPGSKDKPGILFGPLMTMPVHLALHINTGLTKLDLSHNGIGDAGAQILGTALRRNRTLTSLKLDGNGVELEGLKAIRGCLHGNKKLVELPFLDDDMSSILENLGKQYVGSLQQEVQARIEIGQAYKYYGGGRVHHGMQQAAMAKLKGAKQVQSRTQQTKNKLRTTAAHVQGDILRNQIVAEIKTAKVLAKSEDKASLKALKNSSKATERLNKMEERNKKKAWENRYKLMQQWKRAAEGAKSDKRANNMWWTRWLNEWGRAYLTADGLASLWDAVPAGERQRYQSTYDYSRHVFDGQKELSDQIRELRLLKQTGEADGAYHAKEAEYYSFVASKDPARVPANPPPPGIEQGRKPGDLNRDFRGYGGRVDWTARRSAIIGDINTTIRSGPPKDFKWTPLPNPSNPPKPNTTPAAATAAGAPMLAFGTPVTEVTGTPAGGGAAAAHAISAAEGNNALRPLSVPPPSSYDPNYIPTPTANQSPPPFQPTTAPPPGYPGAGAGSAATTPYVPPPAPEPYQAAAAAPGGAQGYHFYNSYLEDEERFQNRPPEYQNYYYGPGRYGGAYDPYGDDDYYYDRNGRRRRRYSDDGFGGGSVLPFLLLTSALYSPFYSPWYGGFWGFGYGGYWGGGWGGYNSYNYTEVNNYNITENNNQTADELGETPPEDVAEAQEGAEEADAGGGEDGGGDGDAGEDGGGDGGEAEGMDMYGGAGPTDLPDGGDGDGGGNAVRATQGGGWKRKAEAGGFWEEDAWEAESVRLWFERRWAVILAAADEKVLGPTRVLPFQRQAMAFPSKKAQHLKARCTLVTQASLDRQGQILEQAAAWGGRISLALYIEAPRGSAASAVLLERAEGLHSALETGPAAVDISLLWAVPEPRTDYDRMYPINALRNLALSAAATELVFLLDIDFQPSKGLLEAAEGCAPEWNVTARAVQAVAEAAHANERAMLVVPAFEVAQSPKIKATSARRPAMPRHKRQLGSMLKTGAASGFHVAHFPQGHSPTEYPRWLASRAPYVVPFSEYFEPYVIAARALVPPYDERFRGYGMNKISHLYASAAAGFRFVVAPEPFVAAFEHEKSDSWHATFGGSARAEQKVRISALYRRFKQELRCLPGAIDPLAAPCNKPSPAAGAAPIPATAKEPHTLGKRSSHPSSTAQCKRHQLDPVASPSCVF